MMRSCENVEGIQWIMWWHVEGMELEEVVVVVLVVWATSLMAAWIAEWMVESVAERMTERMIA